MTNKAATALEGLIDTMDKGGDFPALSRTITEINHAVGDENSRASRMTEIILRDISLTKKLLRLVNAAHYGSFGSQPINTISRAVVILAFNNMRNAAVSPMRFEHLQQPGKMSTTEVRQDPEMLIDRKKKATATKRPTCSHLACRTCPH